jgi:hypothetical protein
MITGRHEEPASSGHGTTTPSTIVRTAKRNPFVVQSTAAKKACGNISELPSDLITWLLMHVGAVGQWRMRAVCKIFRTLALKIDSVAVSDSSGLTEKGGRERGRESERVAERDRKRERDVYVGGSYTQEHLRMVRCTYHTHTRTHTHTHTHTFTRSIDWNSEYPGRPVEFAVEFAVELTHTHTHTHTHVQLLQDHIPSLLLARKANQLVWGLEEISAWVVLLAPKTANGNKGQIAHRFLIYTLAYTVRHVLGCDSDCQVCC